VDKRVVHLRKGWQTTVLERFVPIQTRTTRGHLARSIRKYGWENFTKTVILRCNATFLTHYEKKFIAMYGSNSQNGLNTPDGGDGCRGLIRTAEHTRKSGIANQGRPLSVETRQKISKARLGRKTDPAKVRRGYKHSDEIKKNISQMPTIEEGNGRMILPTCGCTRRNVRRCHNGCGWNGKTTPRPLDCSRRHVSKQPKLDERRLQHVETPQAEET